MESHEIEHFLHGQGAKPKVATAALGEALREVLLRTDMIREGETEIFVFVGECDEALNETDETALARRKGYSLTLLCGEDVAASYTLQLAVLTAAGIAIRCFPGAVQISLR